MQWLDSGSVEVLAEVLRSAAPELVGLPIEPRAMIVQDDSQWWSSSARIGDEFIAKFAWSRPAAQRLAHEIDILTALADGSAVPFLPEVVVASVEPVLLITRRVPGSSLFAVVEALDRDDAGDQLAQFLAALHDGSTHELLATAVADLTTPALPAETTAALRERLLPYVRPDQRSLVLQWCDWTDCVLAAPSRAVVVHADLHGDNQVWAHGRLRLIVDFETVGLAEAEYDLRALPGTGPGVDLLVATMKHYEQRTRRLLSTDRVMAWHVRNALGDVLWRTAAGVPLPDHRTPSEWINDISLRFRTLAIDTSRPPT